MLSSLVEPLHFTLLWKGILTGLAVGVPVGPIGILCIQRTLAKGREYGLVSGLGGASADAIFGFIACSCLVFVQPFMKEHQEALQMIGGVFLCLLGVRTFISRPHFGDRPINGIGLLRAFSTAFIYTLTNWHILWLIVTAFAAFRVAAADTNGDLLHTMILVGGIFAGSAFWGLLIAGGTGYLRARSDRNVLIWVNHIGGVLLGLIGVVILLISIIY